MKRISNRDLDKKFDDGEDILKFKKEGSEKVFKTEVRKVNVDFPVWMIEALDVEAKRIGVTRQALIKTIVDNELKKRNVA
jgi:hypothetical protein